MFFALSSASLQPDLLGPNFFLAGSLLSFSLLRVLQDFNTQKRDD